MPLFRRSPEQRAEHERERAERARDRAREQLPERVADVSQSFTGNMLYAFERRPGPSQVVRAADEGARTTLLGFLHANLVAPEPSPPELGEDVARNLAEAATARPYALSRAFTALMYALVVRVAAEVVRDRSEFDALLDDVLDLLAFPEDPIEYRRLWGAAGDDEVVAAYGRAVFRELIRAVGLKEADEATVDYSTARVNFTDFYRDGEEAAVVAYNR